MCRSPLTSFRFLLVFMVAAASSVGVHSQTPPSGGGTFAPSQSFDPLQQFGTPPGLSFDARVEFEGSFRVKQSSGEGQLQVRATIQPNWHIYSLTQAPGGPNRTELTVPPSPDFELTGPFSADRDPFKHSDEVFPGIEVEEYADEVVFSAPFKIKEGVAPESLKIAVTVDAQVCETGGACELIESELVEATFAGLIEEQAPTGTYYEDGSNIRISGHFDPQTVTPGGVVTLELTADLEPEWHVYAYGAEKVEGTVASPTLIVIRKSAGFEVGTPEPSAPPTETDSGLEEEPILRYHKESITWSLPITIPKATESGEYEIAGSIAYQTCTDAACDAPQALQFAATIKVGTTAAAGQVPLVFQPSSYAEVAQLAATQAKQQTIASATATAGAGKWSEYSIFKVLGFAFLAGLILNVMPCVLPVIGLKIMSFVQQSGGDRWEIFSLNALFSLGLLTVFWVLATLAAFLQMGWGEHFGNLWFTVTMICVVFAFGLSFLGVWEIPIPGFVTTPGMQKAAEREGAAGAYSKGILTTILATPCAGPLLVPAVNWAIAQPAWLTYVAFTAMGLGMAAPYLLIGVFPALINWLPKPGAWMDTFKQLMGFLLMGTVVFLFNSIGQKAVIPTLTLLVGVGIACWWWGRTPMTAELGDRLRSYLQGAVVLALAALLGFVGLVPRHELDWQPYSRVALDEHLSQGRTVLVDFTADW
jgi:suppressor for copper-sensitivity B